MRQAREEWKTHRQPHMLERVHRLVFLDETGTTTKMTACADGLAAVPV